MISKDIELLVHPVLLVRTSPSTPSLHILAVLEDKFAFEVCLEISNMVNIFKKEGKMCSICFGKTGIGILFANIINEDGIRYVATTHMCHAFF